MSTFNVLDSETNVFGHYFLEASAGTGKTFAIENIVPRLIIESSNPLTIDEILVVTFTRAATRELKARIYKNLLKIASALDKGEGGPPYLDSIYKKGKEALSTAKRRVEEALFCFEEAQIFTLHGFCLSILQEFAFDTQFFNTVADEEDLVQKEKIKVYIKDFLRRGLSSDFISFSQMKRICTQRQVGKDIEALCDIILRTLAKEHTIRSSSTAKEQWTAWGKALQSFPSLSAESLWKELSLVSPRLITSKKWNAQITWFFSFLEKQSCSFSEWDAFLGEKAFFLEQVKSVSKKNEKELRYPGLFEEMKKHFIPLYEEATDEKMLLLQLSLACKSHYDKGKKDLSHFTPDDFVLQLKKALESTHVQEKIKAKYKALIIDEFQDTDPDQWEIFRLLFLEKDKMCPTLYLVGDPKQSIYGFRSADVYIYLRARALFEASRQCYLGTNFRSHPDLIAALNTIFSFDLPDRWMQLPFTKESLEVRSVNPKTSFSSIFDAESIGRLHFFLKEDGGDSAKQWPREEIEEEILIPYIAKEILRLQSEKSIKFEQIAILIKDRYQASRLRDSFKLYGIPCQMQKSFDENSRGCEAMRSLLQALVRPSDLSVLKKLLGGLLIGHNEEEIRGSWENGLLQKARGYFLEASYLVKRKGFGAFFFDFLESPSKEEGKSIAEELLSREDSSLYFEIRQLCQTLLEYGSSAFYDAEELLVFLEKMRELDASSDVLKQVEEEEEDQVQVMTLHKSKGLEFEVVFALALASRYAGKEDYISIRSEEGREIIIAKEEEESYRLHTEEIDAEKLRQLYVALTRAKERVYIPCVLPKCAKEIKKGTAAPIELFLGGFGLSCYSFEAVYKKIAGFSIENCVFQLERLKEQSKISYEILSDFLFLPPSFSKKEGFLIPPPKKQFSFEESFLLSFSSISQENKKNKEVIFLDKFSSEEPYIIPVGAETGTVIHAILESLCKADLHRVMGDEALSIVRKFCKGSILEGKELEVFKMLENAIKTKIVTSVMSFALNEIPSSDMQVEMEFLYPQGSSLIKGFIDLIFRFQGQYFILDWKTNALGLHKEDYSLEKIHECMEEHDYYMQSMIYTTALEKFLSFFEERPFREVFGGAVYFFLRGESPFFFRPDLLLSQKDIECGVFACKET